MKNNSQVYIGTGGLHGKGVYANKDFKKNEIVIQYHLIPLSEVEYKKLSAVEKDFTHLINGIIYLYSEPERYVNHSEKPNTIADLNKQCDIALRDIKKDEMITCDATQDDNSHRSRNDQEN